MRRRSGSWSWPVTGASFCAGADIGWMRAAMSLDVEANEHDAMAMADMFETIDTCPVPVIARVHGAALGGGMGLCAVSDLVVAESGARFGFTETRLGILPAVISPFVVAKIGESHARALFPSGRRFDAVRAQRIGLVHEVVEGEDALDAAVETAIADVLAAGPTAARAAKAIIREVRGLGHGSSKWHTARVIARQRVTRRGARGLRRVRREAPPGLGARPRYGRVIERLLPERLGRDFRWLWSSAALTNLGDGMLLAAGPLLVTTVSRDPLAVGLSVAMQYLPWVLIGLPAGAIIDRVDRRKVSIAVNLLRARRARGAGPDRGHRDGQPGHHLRGPVPHRHGRGLRRQRGRARWSPRACPRSTWASPTPGSSGRRS